MICHVFSSFSVGFCMVLLAISWIFLCLFAGFPSLFCLPFPWVVLCFYHLFLLFGCVLLFFLIFSSLFRWVLLAFPLRFLCFSEEEHRQEMVAFEVGR